MKIGIIGIGGIFSMHMDQIKKSNMDLDVAAVSDISTLRIEWAKKGMVYLKDM